MRIGIVFPEAFSLWRFHRGLLEELLGHGCEVYVLCPPGECMDQIKSLGVVFLPVEMYRFLNPLKDLRFILRLYRLFRRYRFDIVHTFTIKQNIYGTLAARIAGVRTVLSSVLGAGFFNTPVASLQVRVARFMIHVLLRISGRLVTRVWFVNPDDLQFFLRKGYVSPEKCVLVRSGGVSVTEYDPATVPAGQRERTWQERALAPDEPTVLETNESGELQIPAGVLDAGPHARFRLEHEGKTLRLVPEAPHALWETLAPEERARTFRDWVARLPKRRGPAIPGEALRRENLYD